MKFSLIIATALSGLVFFSACKKGDDTSTPAPTYYNTADPASAKVNGTQFSWKSPATTDSTYLDEIAIDANGSMFWSANEDTITIVAGRKMGVDTVFMYMTAVMPAAKLGSYSLNWTGINPMMADSETFPLSCYYGSLKDLQDALLPPNTQDQAALLAWLAKISQYNGTGNLTITGFANNKLTGTFNFTSNLGSTRTNALTEGKFTNINKINN